MLRKLGTVAMVATLMLGSMAWAEDLTWTNKATDGVWDEAGSVNWTPDAGATDKAFASGDNAIFTGTPEGTVTLGAANVTAGTITVNGGTYTINNSTKVLTATTTTISGGTTSLTLANTGINSLGAITVNNGASLTISIANQIANSALTLDGGTLNTGVVAGLINAITAGAGGATVNVNAAVALSGNITGVGSLTLKGVAGQVVTLGGAANTYTGTTIDTVTAAIDSNAKLGAATGGVTFLGGGKLAVTANIADMDRDMTFTSPGTIDVSAGSLANAGDLFGAGNITIKGNKGLILTGSLDGYGGATSKVTLDDANGALTVSSAFDVGTEVNGAGAGSKVTIDAAGNLATPAVFDNTYTGLLGLFVDGNSVNELAADSTHTGGTTIVLGSTVKVSGQAGAGSIDNAGTLEFATTAKYAGTSDIANAANAVTRMDSSWSSLKTAFNSTTNDGGLYLTGNNAVGAGFDLTIAGGTGTVYTGDVPSFAEDLNVKGNALAIGGVETAGAGTATEVSFKGLAADAATINEKVTRVNFSGALNLTTTGLTVAAGQVAAFTGASYSISGQDVINNGRVLLDAANVAIGGVADSDIDNTSGIITVSGDNLAGISFIAPAVKGAVETGSQAKYATFAAAAADAVIGSTDAGVTAADEQSFDNFKAGTAAFALNSAPESRPTKVNFNGAVDIAAGGLTNVDGTTINLGTTAAFSATTNLKNAAGGTVTLASDAGGITPILTAFENDKGLFYFTGSTDITTAVTIAGDGTVETREIDSYGNFSNAGGTTVFGTNGTAATDKSATTLEFTGNFVSDKAAFGTTSPDSVSFGGTVSITDAVNGLKVGTGKTVNFAGTSVTALIDVDGGTANFNSILAAPSGLKLALGTGGTANINENVAGELDFVDGLMTIATGKTFTATNAVITEIGSAPAAIPPAFPTNAATVELGVGGTVKFSNGVALFGDAMIKGSGTVDTGAGNFESNGTLHAVGGDITVTSDSLVLNNNFIDEGGITVGLNGTDLSKVVFDNGNVIFGLNSFIGLDAAATAARDTLIGDVMVETTGTGSYIDISGSGWYREVGGFFYTRANVDDWLLLDATDTTITYQGTEAVVGSVYDRLDSYWYGRKGVHTNGLYTRAGAHTLVDAAREIIDLGAPYGDQGTNLVHLSGLNGSWWNTQGSRELLSNFNYTMGQAYTKPLIVSMENIRNISREFKLYAPTFNVATNNVYSDAGVKSSDAYAASRVDCNYNYANGFFAGGIGLWQDLDTQSNGAGGYDYDSAGLITGYAHRFGAFNIGAAFAYNTGDYNDKLALWNNSDIDNYSFLLSLSYQHPSGFFAGLTGGYAYSDYDLKSGVAKAVTQPVTGNVVNAIGRERASYNSDNWLVDFEIGYEWKPTACLSIIPSTGLSYVHSSASDFNARWNGVDAAVPTPNAYETINRIFDLSGDSLQLPIDLAIAYDIPVGTDSKFRIMVNGGYAYEFEDSGPDGRLAWGGVGIPNVIGIRDRNIGRNIWNVGAGLQYTAGRFDFAAKYDYYSRSQMDTHRLVGTVGIRF